MFVKGNWVLRQDLLSYQKLYVIVYEVEVFQTILADIFLNYEVIQVSPQIYMIAVCSCLGYHNRKSIFADFCFAAYLIAQTDRVALEYTTHGLMKPILYLIWNVLIQFHGLNNCTVCSFHNTINIIKIYLLLCGSRLKRLRIFIINCIISNYEQSKLFNNLASK